MEEKTAEVMRLFQEDPEGMELCEGVLKWLGWMDSSLTPANRCQFNDIKVFNTTLQRAGNVGDCK